MHQELVTDVENKIKSMGLVIKPKKCCSLAIHKSKTVNIQFRLKDKETGDNINIASVIEKPMTFLGSEVAESNTRGNCKCVNYKCANLKDVKVLYL